MMSISSGPDRVREHPCRVVCWLQPPSESALVEMGFQMECGLDPSSQMSARVVLVSFGIYAVRRSLAFPQGDGHLTAVGEMKLAR